MPKTAVVKPPACPSRSGAKSGHVPPICHPGWNLPLLLVETRPDFHSVTGWDEARGSCPGSSFYCTLYSKGGGRLSTAYCRCRCLARHCCIILQQANHRGVRRQERGTPARPLQDEPSSCLPPLVQATESWRVLPTSSDSGGLATSCLACLAWPWSPSTFRLGSFSSTRGDPQRPMDPATHESGGERLGGAGGGREGLGPSRRHPWSACPMARRHRPWPDLLQGCRGRRSGTRRTATPGRRRGRRCPQSRSAG